MAEPIIDSNYSILFEDDSYLAIGKSGNCPVHEGGLYFNNSLTRLLEKNLGDRVYPVYRIDRETSGIIVFAKSREKVKFANILGKEYLGVCEGIIDKEIIIESPIGEIKGEFVKWKMAAIKEGRPAKTIVNPIISGNNRTLCRIIPLTGRQHQIRVHMQSAGYSIVGDKMYGASDKIFLDYINGKKIDLPISRQALHLHKIILNDNEIISPLPKDIEKLISNQ
jgi:RluA family pseudouridine synthase